MLIISSSQFPWFLLNWDEEKCCNYKDEALCSSAWDVWKVIQHQFTLDHCVLLLWEGRCSALPCRHSIVTSSQAVSAHVTESQQNIISLHISLCLTSSSSDLLQCEKSRPKREMKACWSAIFILLLQLITVMCKVMQVFYCLQGKKFIFNIMHFSYIFHMKLPLPVTLAVFVILLDFAVMLKASQTISGSWLMI